MKSHIEYGITFMRYSGQDDAAELNWNILDDHNANQFLKHFVFFFEKTIPWITLLNIFVFYKKYLYSSRNSTSSFDEQGVL